MPYLKRADAEIYYEVYGAGRPFLFCSATGVDGQCWKEYQVPEFSRDHQVILFDYRGTGKSSKTVTKYTTAMFAADAAAILDELGAEQAIVCGHSMGGRVAQLLALDHPRKVSKLILASSGASFSETKGIPLKMCQGMIEKGFEKYVREHTIETGWTPEYVAAHRDVVEKFLEVRMAGIAPLPCYLRHAIARQEHDTRGRLKDIRVPTLVLVGEDEHDATSDLSHRDSAEIFRREIPNARFVVLRGQRHHYFVSDPAAVHEAIREFIG
ncbi:MAG TPA: alpha/beta fold hydrolase [Candidatus Acidoferrales bacterium]|nr:alpha/beta fold hydrolase [Candidatus Acidoferrales bacterium]